MEDNPGDVRLTEEAFKEGNITNVLHVVSDGIEALDFIYQRGDHAAAPRPDVNLLDLNLPRKTGEEVLAEIRADDNLRCIPVIISTSSQAEEDIVRSDNLCANASLPKPVNPDECIETIRLFERFWPRIIRLPSVDN